MGTNHQLDAMTQWDMYDSFEVPEEVQREIDAVIHTPGYCASLRPFPDALDGVNRLRSVADVYVVTSPWTSSPTWEYERRDWIYKHLGISKSHLISTSAKHVCAGDFLIDDKHANLDAWFSCNPHGCPIRWLGPANKNQQYEGITVSDWSTAIDWITGRTIVKRAWRTQ